MTNTNGDFIKSVFPQTVNRNTPIFKALFADKDESGTVETIFNLAEVERKNWCKGDIYSQDGEQALKTLSFISELKRGINESVENFLQRNKQIFYRNGDTTWGSVSDIEKIFRNILKSESVWIVNNTDHIDNTLFLNGNFDEEGLSDVWIRTGCEENRTRHLEGDKCIVFTADKGVFEQTVNVESRETYFTHYFLDGFAGVEIIDNNGRYWDAKNGEFGKWVEEEVFIGNVTEAYLPMSTFFITDENVSSVKIKFIGYKGSAIDYVRLFKKTNTITFSLVGVVNFEALVSSLAGFFSPGSTDPISGIKYDKQSYFDKNHTTEQVVQFVRNNIYEELLTLLKATGTVHFIELLEA